jgi:hypothetical protein
MRASVSDAPDPGQLVRARAMHYSLQGGYLGLSPSQPANPQ